MSGQMRERLPLQLHSRTSSMSLVNARCSLLTIYCLLLIEASTHLTRDISRC